MVKGCVHREAERERGKHARGVQQWGVVVAGDYVMGKCVLDGGGKIM